MDVIDLLQFHWPDETGVPVEDSWGEMARLVQDGKVRFVGVCNFSTELLERCERIRHVDSLQPPFSMITRDAGGGSIPWALAHGTGVIVYSPMKAGLLTDGFSRERVAAMDAGDWRRQNPDFNEPGLTRNLALRDALRPIADRHGTTVASVAIAWTLAWPGVTAAIVGARSPEQVDGWLGAGNVTRQPPTSTRSRTRSSRPVQAPGRSGRNPGADRLGAGGQAQPKKGPYRNGPHLEAQAEAGWEPAVPQLADRPRRVGGSAATGARVMVAPRTSAAGRRRQR